VVAEDSSPINEVNLDILGIDVGERLMHAVLLQGDRTASKSVPNTVAGFKQLQTWLRNRKVEGLHACLEATGGWSEDVAIALAGIGFSVSLVNPMCVKAFAQSEMLRTKTDQIDAALSCAILSYACTAGMGTAFARNSYITRPCSSVSELNSNANRGAESTSIANDWRRC
jgi:transposase